MAASQSVAESCQSWAVARGEGCPVKMMYDLQTGCGNGARKGRGDVIGGRAGRAGTSLRGIAVLALMAGRSATEA